MQLTRVGAAIVASVVGLGGVGTAGALAVQFGDGNGWPPDPSAGATSVIGGPFTVPVIPTTGPQLDIGAGAGGAYVVLGPGDENGLAKVAVGAVGGGVGVYVEDHTGGESVMDRVEDLDAALGCHLNPSDPAWCDPHQDSPSDAVVLIVP